HRRGANKAAIRGERIEIERYVCKRGRQNSARSAAWKVTVQRVTVEHATAVFVDEFQQGDSGRRDVHARPFDASANRERAESPAAVPSVTGEPRGSLLDEVAHPVQRFQVVFERGTAE